MSGQSNLNGLGRIGVGKRGSCRRGLLVIAEHLHHGGGIHRQLTIAVVRDGNSHVVGGVVIRNAGDFIGGGNLGDVVLISAGFREGDTSEVKADRRSVSVSLIRHRALSIAYAISRFSSLGRQRSVSDSLQPEGKGIAGLPIAAIQNLFSLERITVVIRAYRNFLGVIGVGHRNFLGCTCRDRALAAISNARLSVAFGQLFFRDSIGAAYGQAFNLGSLAVFQGKFTVVLNRSAALFNTRTIGNGVGVLAIRPGACQRKLHRKVGVCVRGQAHVGFHLLGNLHAAGGAHGQLAVVAKVQHTTALVKVPLEVNAAIGGAGFVLILINGGGQADFFGARLDVVFAIIF